MSISNVSSLTLVLLVLVVIVLTEYQANAKSLHSNTLQAHLGAPQKIFPETDIWVDFLPFNPSETSSALAQLPPDQLFGMLDGVDADVVRSAFMQSIWNAPSLEELIENAHYFIFRSLQFLDHFFSHFAETYQALANKFLQLTNSQQEQYLLLFGHLRSLYRQLFQAGALSDKVLGKLTMHSMDDQNILFGDRLDSLMEWTRELRVHLDRAVWSSPVSDVILCRKVGEEEFRAISGELIDRVVEMDGFVRGMGARLKTARDKVKAQDKVLYFVFMVRFHAEWSRHTHVPHLSHPVLMAEDSEGVVNGFVSGQDPVDVAQLVLENADLTQVIDVDSLDQKLQRHPSPDRFLVEAAYSSEFGEVEQTAPVDIVQLRYLFPLVYQELKEQVLDDFDRLVTRISSAADRAVLNSVQAFCRDFEKVLWLWKTVLDCKPDQEECLTSSLSKLVASFGSIKSKAAKVVINRHRDIPSIAVIFRMFEILAREEDLPQVHLLTDPDRDLKRIARDFRPPTQTLFALVNLYAIDQALRALNPVAQSPDFL